ncbi:MAG: Gfo/Idh/MocA family protein [Bacillota bacterium]
MSLFKVAVIGCGWAGRLHALAYRDNPDVELVGLVDPLPETGERLAREVRVPYYKDLDALLAAVKDVTAVSVCTPADTHYEVVSACLERDLHALCEKPLARDPQKAAHMVEKARAKGLLLCVHHNQRFAAAIQMAKDELKGQTVHYLVAAMYQNGPKELRPPTIDRYFLVTDAACHLLDTIRFLHGDPCEIYAVGTYLESEILADLIVSLRFADGSIGSLITTFVGGMLETQHPFQHLEIVTAEKRMVVENMSDRLIVYPHAEPWQRVWTPSYFAPRDYAASMKASVDAWIRAVAKKMEGRPPDDRLPRAVTAEEGLAVVRLCAAIIRSLEEGRPISL